MVTLKEKKSKTYNNLKNQVEKKLRADAKKESKQNIMPQASKKTGPVKVTVKGMEEDGKGIIEYEGQLVKIPYLITGEKAMVELKRKGRYFDAKLLKVVEQSADRVKPKCPYFYDCGGCHLQHMNDAAQNKHKEAKVQAIMKPFGQCQPIIVMDDPYYYRNKCHATFASRGRDDIFTGIYKEYTHEVVKIDKCIIQDKLANSIIDTVTTLAKSFKYKAYNEDTGEGLLRHVMVRVGHQTREAMVVLVMARNLFPSKNNFIKALIDKHPEIKTIVMNINDKSTSMVLGDRENVVYGNGYIEDILGGYRFKISSKTFYQVNTEQTEKLYAKALEYADLKGRETVLDAYCGIGTISLLASKRARKVMGVELNKDSVKNAIDNAKLNNVKNTTFYQADAGEFMVELAEKDHKIDVVFMDPPRSGSDEPFLESLVKLAPKKIVYISCNPETQARDLKYLTKKGYKVDIIQPVDLFPSTFHVESIVLMSKA